MTDEFHCDICHVAFSKETGRNPFGTPMDKEHYWACDSCFRYIQIISVSIEPYYLTINCYEAIRLLRECVEDAFCQEYGLPKPRRLKAT